MSKRKVVHGLALLCLTRVANACCRCRANCSKYPHSWKEFPSNDLFSLVCVTRTREVSAGHQKDKSHGHRHQQYITLTAIPFTFPWILAVCFTVQHTQACATFLFIWFETFLLDAPRRAIVFSCGTVVAGSIAGRLQLQVKGRADYACLQYEALKCLKRQTNSFTLNTFLK